MENDALSLFSQKDPGGAVKLSFLSPDETLISSEDNLYRKIADEKIFYHNQDEMKQWWSSLSLNADVLIIFGLGLGYAYDFAEKWLKSDSKRHLLFLEDDLSVLYHFLQSKKSQTILTDPQVTIRTFSDLERESSLIEQLTWDLILRQIEVTALPLYAKRRPALYKKLERLLLFNASMKNDSVYEYLELGAPFFKNFYPNLTHLPNSHNGHQFFGHFEGVPAIICGAGPSLQKNGSQLAFLKDNALLFAGGSAINALNALDIHPHFGAGIDPNPTQHERFKKHSSKNIPFFYRNRLEHRALLSIGGPRLYIKGAGGYPTANWFEEQLDIEGEPNLDEGYNVVNFCTQIALQMGCNPILFVGLDLAYTDQKSYAEGVIENPELESKESGRFETRPYQKEELLTHWKWEAEAQWIASFAQENPETTFINATQGGIGIPGVENQPLSSLPLDQSYPLTQKIASLLTTSEMTFKKERIVKLLKELLQSLKKSEGLLQAKSYPELLLEPAYHAVLAPFDSLSQQIPHVLPGSREEFLLNVIRLNRGIIAEVL